MKQNHLAYEPSSMALISHELRIPAAEVLGVTQLLKTTPLTKEQSEYLSLIQSSVNRLLKLETTISELLNTKQ